MKIALVSSTPPLVNGGHRNIVCWLAPELQKAGHKVETIWLPFLDEPEQILPQTVAYRLLRLEDTCDAIVTFRPPAHVVRHPRKLVWFIHHLRQFYDLWGTTYSIVPDTLRWRNLRDQIRAADTKALSEAAGVFTSSATVSERLLRFNGISSRILYPPLGRMRYDMTPSWGDELVMICRMESHKRQHLAVEAMKHVITPVRLRLCGVSTNAEYTRSLRNSILSNGLGDRVTLEACWISEEQKARYLSSALAAIYLAEDEDSYGYPTLEAAHAAKATVVTQDGGGVREFVVDGENGLVVAPEPGALAACFDRLWSNRHEAQALGRAAASRVQELGITWERVTRALIEAATRDTTQLS